MMKRLPRLATLMVLALVANAPNAAAQSLGNRIASTPERSV